MIRMTRTELQAAIAAKLTKKETPRERANRLARERRAAKRAEAAKALQVANV